MRKCLLVSVIALIGVIAISFQVSAQNGWQSNGVGGVYGTGNNAGGGYQSNGVGGVYGTGNNAGRNCQSNGVGGMYCN
jgi:hypothetical protein